MMMKNKMIRALGLSAVAVGLNIGVANAEVINATAQVVVLSTLTVAETSALSFGTIAAFADGSTSSTKQAVLTVASSGSTPTIACTGCSTTTPEATIVSIIDGSPGVYTVTGAAANTVLSIAIATASGVMKDPSVTAGPQFTLAALGLYMTVNGSSDTFTTDTDATGNMEFQVGGTLTTTVTNAAATTIQQSYPDATYTGTFEVTITY